MQQTSNIKGFMGSKNFITVLSLHLSTLSIFLCLHYLRRYFPLGSQERHQQPQVTNSRKENHWLFLGFIKSYQTQKQKHSFLMELKDKRSMLDSKIKNPTKLHCKLQINFLRILQTNIRVSFIIFKF